MNKQEFIAYIEKIPEEIEFTPMEVDISVNTPNPDGSYRNRHKKIKFECTYTEMVHNLPFLGDGRKSNENIVTDLNRELDKAGIESIKFHSLDDLIQKEIREDEEIEVGKLIIHFPSET